MTAIRTLFLIVALSAVSVGLVEDKRPLRSGSDRMAYLDNGIIKLGVDLDRGGSIGFLADVKKGGNVVNVHDLGRWIGQSYYSGPKPFGIAHPAWKGWPWNPVGAGDVYGNPSKLLDKKNDGKVLYVKSIPMQWALENVPGDCTFETWILLEDRAIQVRNRLTNKRKDKRQYSAMDQELPAIYTIGKLHRLMAYTGDSPFTGKPLQEVPKQPAKEDKPQWTTFFAAEHWVALVDDEDWGLGIIQPGVVRFLGGFSGKPNTGGPADDPCGYAAPLRQEILDHNIVYDYRYTLVLDSLPNIRKKAYRQRPKSSLPDYRFTNDRRHWWFVNLEDTGWPIKDCLRMKVERDDPQMYGPEECWDAKDAPKIFLRAAYRTKHRTAELFWETARKPGFRSEQSVKFTVRPDGEVHTYEVDLSACANYRGRIRRLRFDPVEAGGADESVDVELISAKKE